MNEKPLERLNYFNGQRLQAADLKLEQDYHIRVRRWLNRSLYTDGIANGLEVRKVPGAPRVRIGAGLALDAMGREIILLEEREETVPGAHDDENRPLGLYLTIRYREDVLARQNGSCVPQSGSQDKAAWGGPSRVLADPAIEWSREVPHEDSGKVLLAYVGLGKGCKDVNLLDTGVRRYVGAASAAKVRQYALEGARDLDAANPADVSFHIRGRQPTSVTLYLRADPFPTFHYTEVGQHAHGLHVSVVNLQIPAHKHDMPQTVTGAGSAHGHTVSSIMANADADVWKGVTGLIAGATAGYPPAVGVFAALALQDAFNPNKGAYLTLSPDPFRQHSGDNLQTRVNMSIGLADEDQHTHGIPSSTNDFPSSSNPQVIPLSATATSDNAGITDPSVPQYSARAGAPLTYVDAMHVSFDGVDVTDAVLRQIRNSRPPTENWAALGNGLESHPLSARGLDAGTGPIRLDFLPGVTIAEGEHRIVLSVAGVGNGGRVHFNLYVE